MRQTDWRVHLALLFVQLTFGGFHVIGKGVLAHLPPLALASMRVLGATPLLLVVAWRIDRVMPAKRDLPALAGLGLLGVCLNQILFLTGLQHTTATNAGILMPSIPVFTVAIAAIFGIEKLRWLRVFGVGFAVAGALVMLNPLGPAVNGGGMLVGNLLIICNCIAYAAFLVWQRPMLRRLPPLTVIAYAFLFGGLGVLAVGARSLLGVSPAEVPAKVWWGIAYIVLIPTALNYVLNSWAISRSSPSLVAVYSLFQPLATALLAAAFLGESAGWREAAGFVLIMAGLVLVNRSLNQANGQKENG